VVEFISMLALAGILTWGGLRVQAGTLTLGVVAAFLQYGLRFFRADSGPQREVQHPAGRDGFGGAYLQAPRYVGGDSHAIRAPAHAGRHRGD